MRNASIAIVWMVCWACAGSDTEPPDPRVLVADHLMSTWPEPSPGVTFFDPKGETLPRVHLSSPPPDGMDYASMPGGGSVNVFTNISASPTDTVWHYWSIADVMPGDTFVFDGTAPHLPADCTHHSITSFMLDPTMTKASWEDPDAASVDARIVHRSSGCNNHSPPILCVVTVEVDGSSATSVDAHPVSGGPGTGGLGTDVTSVDLVVCRDEHYDDIRTLLTASFTPGA